jgi:hypothetical protein
METTTPRLGKRIDQPKVGAGIPRAFPIQRRPEKPHTVGQVIDVLVSQQRNLAATRRFFTRAMGHGPRPSEVSTHQAPAYPRVVDELLPVACHVNSALQSARRTNDQGW